MKTVMLRPALSVQTVYFHESEQEKARALGMDLFEQLTRPVDAPLAYGVGIPVLSGVLAEAVDVKAADVVVLVPVLGATTFHTQREVVLKQLVEWHKTLEKGHVLVVPTAPVWRNVEEQLLGKPMLTELYGEDDRRQKTLDEIVLGVARLFESKTDRVRLFVSHSKADLKETGNAAKQIFDYVVTDTTGKAFFDTADLKPGESLSEQLDDAVTHGVLIAVRGDAYSSRAWCQRELITAKLHELPTLTVEVLKKGERRSSPYGGNGPSLVWDGNPAAIASRAMIEWLRAAYFRKEAERISKLVDLPDDVVTLARPPELLDLAQGRLTATNSQLVLHPDPELPVIERQILKAARPRLQLVTPSTAFRQLLCRQGSVSTVALPLQGFQVAMSLSDSPDVDGPAGYTKPHVEDATVYMARSLISAGASIAFGGDFRRNGFTPLLAELIQAYNQTAASSAPYLHSYLGAPIKLEDAPDDLPLVVHHLVHSPDVRPDAMLPPPSEKERHPDALYFSDMRRVMAKHTSARIILGGAAEPRTAPGSAGYAGRYPGVVEEAWRTLEAGKPLYVIGGFGGAAALVADVLEGAEIPGRLRDQNWDHLPDYKVLAATIDNDPFREKLGLPRSMEDLANALRAYGDPCLKNDESSLAWNGLTVEENRILFRTRDPVAIASLVLRGMLKVSRAHSAGKLEIELIHGSVTSASNLDAVAVAVFDNIPLGGAGAVLDQAIGGHASQEREQGRTLISLTAADVDADWLYLASLGSLKTAAELEQAVEKAARETAEQSQRHGFRRLGVVTFGGAVLSDIETMAHAMLRGFAGLNGAVTVVWFETNADRFNRLQKTLSAEESVQLTTRKVTVAAATPLARAEDLIFQVSLHDDELRVTMLPPAGSAIASSRLVKLSASDMAAFSAGGGLSKRETPDLNALKSRGVQLAATLIGKEATQLLSRCSQARVMIIHDVASSRLPFEILSATDAAVRPAVQAGLSRRLAVDGVPLERLFARPPKAGRLQALLIVNPTEDLPSTLPEAAAVRTILKQQANVELVELAGKQATKQAVLKAFASADVLHYCGHAFFNGPGADQSGLILAGPEPLTLADLADCPSLPRVAFVNACEAGRVRGNIVNEAAAFAELFLRSGVEAYLGTYWQVRDTAASTFAAVVYTQLADGHTLDAAVTEARSKLLAADEPDWANYILYGDGRFQLIAR